MQIGLNYQINDKWLQILKKLIRVDDKFECQLTECLDRFTSLILNCQS